MMNSRFRKLAVESLEGRSVLSTTVAADFNNDGLMDLAAITSPTTVTVSLANQDGTLSMSAILTAPKNHPMTDLSASDRDGDGDLELFANCPAGGGWVYTHMWLGNGDGTFGSRTTTKWAWPPKGNFGFF